MMRLIGLALAWLLASGAADPPAETGTAEVAIILQPNGVHARVMLDRPVERFDFADAATVRAGDFALLTPGLALEGDSVTGKRPFTEFALRIRPAARERDAKYPAHFRLGEGGVLYAPALKGDPERWRTRLSFALAPGHVRTPADGPVEDGFVFIGPARLVEEREGIVLIADPATPPWLVERTGSDLAAGVGAFTEALGTPPVRKPTLIVKHQPGERDFNVGDVTPGAVTAIRFHGAAWEKPNALAAKRIQGFVLHEAFHFWNGGLASPAEGMPAWLHEGGAEYASLLGGLASGVLSEEDVRGRLTEALQRCRQGLQLSGDQALSKMDFLPGHIRYPCGTVLQWASDLHMRRESGGERTVLDAWAETIRTARARPEPRYSLADFDAAAGVGGGQSLAPIALLVHQSGPARWNELPAALGALGAEVSLNPSGPARRFTLLFHLLAESCREVPEGTGRGFYVEERTVKLDSPAGCGILTGDPVLRSVEGGDPFEMSRETWAKVAARCAAGATVAVETGDGRTLAAPCTAPLPPEPRDYAVTAWRPAPAR